MAQKYLKEQVPFAEVVAHFVKGQSETGELHAASGQQQSQVEYIHHEANSVYKPLLHRSLHKSTKAHLMKVYDRSQRFTWGL